MSSFFRSTRRKNDLDLQELTRLDFSFFFLFFRFQESLLSPIQETHSVLSLLYSSFRRLCFLFYLDPRPCFFFSFPLPGRFNSACYLVSISLVQSVLRKLPLCTLMPLLTVCTNLLLRKIRSTPFRNSVGHFGKPQIECGYYRTSTRDRFGLEGGLGRKKKRCT